MKKIFLIGDSIRYGTSGKEGYKNGYGYHIKEIIAKELERRKNDGK